MSVGVDIGRGTLDLEVVVLSLVKVEVDEDTLDLEEDALDVKGWEEEDLDEEDFELVFAVPVEADDCFWYSESLAAWT
jgi:hypothetical protein